MASGTICKQSTRDVVDIKSQTSYGTGFSSSDFIYSAYRIGKIVFVNVVFSRTDMIPSASWGINVLITGLPYLLGDSDSVGIGGFGTNDIPFSISMTDSRLRIKKLQSGTSTGNLPAYFTASIVYVTSD